MLHYQGVDHFSARGGKKTPPGPVVGRVRQVGKARPELWGSGFGHFSGGLAAILVVKKKLVTLFGPSKY